MGLVFLLNQNQIYLSLVQLLDVFRNGGFITSYSDAAIWWLWFERLGCFSFIESLGVCSPLLVQSTPSEVCLKEFEPPRESLFCFGAVEPQVIFCLKGSEPLLEGSLFVYSRTPSDLRNLKPKIGLCFVLVGKNLKQCSFEGIFSPRGGFSFVLVYSNPSEVHLMELKY